MAAAEELEEEAICSICLDLFCDPVMLDCGHNFCRGCIGLCWAGAAAPSCPQCREPLPARGLRPNRPLGNIAERLRRHRPGRGREQVQLQLERLRREKGELKVQERKERWICQDHLEKVKAERQKIVPEFKQLRQYLEQQECLLLARLGELEKQIETRLKDNAAKFSKKIIHLDGLIKEKEHQLSGLESPQDAGDGLSRCERAKLQQKEWTSHKVKKEPGVCSEKVSALRETARKPQGALTSATGEGVEESQGLYTNGCAPVKMMLSRFHSCFSLLVFIVYGLVFQVHELHSAPLKVMGPPGPVIVAVGEDAVLPCRFSPTQSTQDMEVTWYREQLAYFVHRYKGGRDQNGNQMLEYVGRTELWKDGLAKGSVNLTIFDVQLSDRGNYTCFVVSGSDYDEAVVELKVTASGSVPLVTLERYQDGGIRVSCRSAGWYPQPQVLWRDPHGQHLPPLSESVTQDQSSLFVVESSIILTRGTKQNVSCWVRHVLDGQEQGSEFYISDPFFHNAHPFIIALGIVSVAVVILLIFAVYLFKIKGKREDQIGDRDAEIEKQAEELGEYHSPSYMGDFSSGTFLHLGFAPFP
ncbi:hypothetical protein Q9233_000512 [Columba guinea]|nr:hypothetical protein Q9233_000512 [Columba guinea]